MDRDSALRFWWQHNDDPGLFRHALAVEAAMRHFATLRGGDPHTWGLAGLLHDVDYQRHPQAHLQHARAMLAEGGWGEELIRAVESHGWGLCTDVEPRTDLEKTLYAVDELTGLVAACALVRPSRSVMGLELKSVKKKWKTLSFAAGVDRSVIEKGASLMEISLDELIQGTIQAMEGVAETLGLA